MNVNVYNSGPDQNPLSLSNSIANDKKGGGQQKQKQNEYQDDQSEGDKKNKENQKQKGDGGGGGGKKGALWIVTLGTAHLYKTMRQCRRRKEDASASHCTEWNW